MFSRVRRVVSRKLNPKVWLNLREGILHEEGANPDMFVIAFSGAEAGLMMHPYEFMAVTRLMDRPRIYLQDRYNVWYQNGINEKVSNFESLCACLGDKVRKSDTNKLLILGVSSGGFAALLAGHILRADYVHAFGPQTRIDLQSLIRPSEWPLFCARRIGILYARHLKSRRFFDLRKVMSNYNGRTKYYVHYCAQNRPDRERAEYISDVTGVQLLGYPCAKHRVVETMLGNGYLEKLFTTGYLENPVELFNLYHQIDVKENKPGQAEECPRETMVRIVRDAARCRPSIEQVCSSDDLVRDLALDSMARLQIIVELENAFGIRIGRNSGETGDLRTVETIARLVDRASNRR